MKFFESNKFGEWWDSPVHDTMGEDGFIVNFHWLEKTTTVMDSGFSNRLVWVHALSRLYSACLLLSGLLGKPGPVAPWELPP